MSRQHRRATVAALFALAWLVPAASANAGEICAPASCKLDTSAVTRTVGPPTTHGYWAVTRTGKVRRIALGRAPRSAASRSRVVDAAFNRRRTGYWLLRADGTLGAAGRARSFGRLPAGAARPVAFAPTANEDGSWVLTSDGRIHALGKAARYGDVRGVRSRPVTVEATPDGRGYWILTADGRVHAFGSADGYGNGRPGSVALRATPDGLGYWTVSSRGQVTAHGTARRLGSPKLARKVRAVALAPSGDGRGYTVLDSRGRLHAFGTARKVRRRVPGAITVVTGTRRQRGGSTRLVVRIVDAPLGKQPPVRLTRPNGKSARIPFGARLSGVRPGRYVITAPPMDNGDTTAFATRYRTVVNLRRGGRGTVRISYGNWARKSVRVADADLIREITRPAEGRYQLAVEDPRHQLAVGQAFVVRPGAAAPNGLLVHIDRLARRGTTAVIEGHPAPLSEIAPRARLSGRRTIAAANARISQSARSDGGGFDQPLKCKGGASAKVGGTLRFGGELETSLSWGGLLHPLTFYATFAVHATEDAEVDVAVSGKASCELDIDLLKDDIRYGPWEFMLGTVPVSIVPKLNYKLTGTAEVNGQVRTHVDQHLGFSAGVRWDGSRLRPINNVSKRFDVDPPSGELDGTVKAAIGPRLYFDIYDVAGPYISADLFLKYRIDTAADPWWKLTGGVQAGAGISLDVFGSRIEKGIDDVLDHEWTLAQASGGLQVAINDSGEILGAIVGRPYRYTLTGKGSGPLTWKLADGDKLPAGLALSAGGEITGTPTGPCDTPTTFRVVVTDKRGKTATSTLTLRVHCPPLRIADTPLPDAVVGRPYSATVTATGSRQPYTWTAVGLPAGLRMNAATGEISGTPQAPGTSDVTIVVEGPDGQADVVTRKLTVKVGDLAVTDATPPTAVAGVLYRFEVTVTGGLAPYTWELTGGALPAGLTLDTSTGAIAGTPAVPGSETATITVTDANGRTVSRTVTITVKPAAPAIAAGSPPNGTVGAAYTHTFSATGGTEPLTWSVASGSPPDGLTLDPDTGKLSGTPTADGTFTFTVRVTDADERTADRTVTIVVLEPGDPLTLSTTTLRGAYVNTGYEQKLSAAGGKSPYTWSVSSGELPTGLTLNASTGVISGTPTVADESTTFTVTVTDDNGSTADRSFSMTIGRLYQIDAVSCPTDTFCVLIDGPGRARTWNGETWSSNDTTGVYMVKSLDCASASFCMAVTDYNGLMGTSGGAARYNGSGWTDAGAIPDVQFINDLQCPSSTVCWAVGKDTGGNTAAWRWDGASWSSPVAMPGGTGGGLSSITCPTDTSCVTLENASAGSAAGVFRWNGTTWTQSTFNPGPGKAAHNVGCSSPSACVIAGYGWASVWNGTTWSALVEPPSAQDAAPMACSRTGTFCVFGGSTAGGNVTAWDGGQFTVATAPSSQVIRDISCPSAGHCVAVDKSGRYLELKDGSWSTPDVAAP